MPKEYSRTRRVAEQIQRELAVLVQRELNDPRIGLVTISAVDVAPDFSHAKVYVTFLDDAQGRAETLQVLAKAAGYLRSCLARRLFMRSVPELRFLYDDSVSRGNELSALIDEAVASDQKTTE